MKWWSVFYWCYKMCCCVDICIHDLCRKPLSSLCAVNLARERHISKKNLTQSSKLLSAISFFLLHIWHQNWFWLKIMRNLELSARMKTSSLSETLIMLTATITNRKIVIKFTFATSFFYREFMTYLRV